MFHTDQMLHYNTKITKRKEKNIKQEDNMKKRDEMIREIEYLFDQLDENGKRILLLFARKIPRKEKKTD